MKQIVFVILNRGKGNTADAQEVMIISDNTKEGSGGGGITPQQLEERLSGVLTPSLVDATWAMVREFTFIDYLQNNSGTFLADENGNVTAATFQNTDGSFIVDAFGNVIAASIEASEAVVGEFIFNDFLTNEDSSFIVDSGGHVIAKSLENHNSSFEVDGNGNVTANNLYTKSEVDSDFQSSAEKGVANGYASLDESGKVPISQINIDSGGVTPEQLEERLSGVLTPSYVNADAVIADEFIFTDRLKNDGETFEIDGNGNVTAPNLYNKSEVDSAFQSRAEKAVANGYASLDATGKVPISQISDALLGNVVYEGTWNANTNTPNLTTVRPKGQYFITDIPGTFNGVDFETGDWILSNGTSWDKVDNTDAVSLVAGLKGYITAGALRVALNIVDGVSQVAGLTGNISTSALKTALGVSSDVTKDLVSDHVDKNSVTGTAAQQVLSSVPIGEATGIRAIKPDSFLNVRTRFGKSGNQNGVEIKFYLSTTAGTPGQPIPVGSQQIGRYSMTGATINIAGWQREYNINASAMFEGMAPNLSGLTDIMVTNSSPLAIQLTLPQQYYFITAVEVASPSAETITQKSIHITSSK